MHDTSTGILGNKLGSEDLEAAIGASLLEEAKKRLIALADEGFSLELLKDGVSLDLALLDDVGKTVLHAHVHFRSLVVLPAHVVHCRVNSESQVARQSPWRGCPSDEVCFLTVLNDGERDDNCGIRYFFVVRAGLEI